MMFIPRDNIDSTYWINNIDSFIHKEKINVKLNVGDFVCVQIINKKINQNDTQIKTIGKLLDLPTTSQIDKYFGSKIEDNNNESSSNFI